jgi:acetolactate decarboxylase
MGRPVQLALVAAIVITLLATGMFVLTTSAPQDRETLYQMGSLDDLMEGRFAGQGSVAKVLAHGDIGLGTFDGLDGEMIVIGGKCYKALTDGTVKLIAGTETTPFAQVSRFDVDGATGLQGLLNLSEVEALIGSSLPSYNTFYVIRIDGTFDNITVRSVPKQAPPFPSLPDVLANQTVFQYQDLPGTLVGIWSPSDTAGLSSAGFHFHFISDDRTKGGHVLAVDLSDLTAQWDGTAHYDVDLGA